ncbi:hypothetical protein U9M48_029662 [Paspalum notatum var. saurae]|uniref:Uncharacterized protein n=1 Tax=Paspalum notatum var. saurae TaxID=547442 RepID=A0AAQ3TZ32_PASNO
MPPPASEAPAATDSADFRHCAGGCAAAEHGPRAKMAVNSLQKSEQNWIWLDRKNMLICMKKAQKKLLNRDYLGLDIRLSESSNFLLFLAWPRVLASSHNQ